MTYTVRDLMRDLRSGPFTSLGSYPTFFLASDGEALSHKAVRENLWRCARDTRDYAKRGDHWSTSGWAIVGFDVNWEDPELYCSDSGERIESAYAEPDECPATEPAPMTVVPAKLSYLDV